MSDSVRAAVYGFPSFDVVDVPGGAVQVSPLVVGSADLADLTEGALDEIVIQAPAGVAERRYVLAQALRALKVDGRLTLAVVDTALPTVNCEKARLRQVFQNLIDNAIKYMGDGPTKEIHVGCTVGESAKRHQRICVALKPANPTGLDAAIVEGAPRRLDGDGLWTQPGVFSWDRLDPGSALLLKSLPPVEALDEDS